MKTLEILVLLLIAFLLQGTLIAQSDENKSAIAFGGPSISNTTLNGDWVLEGGAIGGGFITKNVYLGGGGFGISVDKNDYTYNMGYGGLMIGYLWGGNEKISMNLYALGGYGGINVETKLIDEENSDLWVVRPAAEVDFRITEWLRIGVGGGYRWIIGSDIQTLSDNDLSASFGSISFRFGNWGK